MSFGTCETVRICPTGEGQGNYVEVNKEDFEAYGKANKWKLYDGPDNPLPEPVEPETPARSIAEIEAELEAAKAAEAAKVNASPGEGWGTDTAKN